MIFTNAPGYEQLTLFQVGSRDRANRSALRDKNEERKMTVISGLKCLELYKKSGPLGSLVRMCLESSIWHSTRCLLTWKVKVTKPNVFLFRLAVSMLRTRENESLLWPTPSTGAALCGGTGNFKTLEAMRKRGLITEEERKELSKGNGGRTNPELLEWLMGYERKFTEELVPTPTASDYRGGCLSRCWMPSRSQTVHVERERERESRGYDGLLRSLVEVTPLGRIGYLNPEYCEWLMGFPIGFTELDA